MLTARKYCTHDGELPDEHDCCRVLVAETEAYEAERLRAQNAAKPAP